MLPHAARDGERVSHVGGGRVAEPLQHLSQVEQRLAAARLEANRGAVRGDRRRPPLLALLPYMQV